MNYLPSKELLSEVLGHKIWKVLDCNMGTLRYCIYPNKEDEPSEYMFPINIHELAHKCKEWALDNGYEFVEDINVNRHSIRIYNCGILVYEKFENYRLSPSDTFKACQWILDNRN